MKGSYEIKRYGGNGVSNFGKRDGFFGKFVHIVVEREICVQAGVIEE